MSTSKFRSLALGAVSALLLVPAVSAAAAAAKPHPSHHRAVRHTRTHRSGIPQHNGGDRDGDNNGAPSDGDGNQ